MSDHSCGGRWQPVADDAVAEDSINRNSIVGEGIRVANALLEVAIVGNNASIRRIYKRINIGDSSELNFD